jgi:hypothetical protein
METGRYLSWCAVVIAIGALYSCVAYEEKGRPMRVAVQAGGYNPPAVQPTTVSQCTRIGENSVFVQRGADSCIQTLKSYGNTTCEGTGEVVDPEKSFDKNLVFSGSLAGNNLCPETITIRQGSPCYLVEINSDSYPPYKLCYHDSQRISLWDCVNHTGVCGPPHNP